MVIYGLMRYNQSKDKYVWILDKKSIVKAYKSIDSARRAKAVYESYYDKVKIVELIPNFSEVI